MIWLAQNKVNIQTKYNAKGSHLFRNIRIANDSYMQMPMKTRLDRYLRKVSQSNSIREF